MEISSVDINKLLSNLYIYRREIEIVKTARERIKTE